eukprot:3896412-Pyramimonas_sp.AAC.2
MQYQTRTRRETLTCADVPAPASVGRAANALKLSKSRMQYPPLAPQISPPPVGAHRRTADSPPRSAGLN